MKTKLLVKIDNCQDCPFCNQDSEYGFNDCNLLTVMNYSKNGFNLPEISLTMPEQMPDKSRHSLCPLDKYSITCKGI